MVFPAGDDLNPKYQTHSAWCIESNRSLICPGDTESDRKASDAVQHGPTSDADHQLKLFEQVHSNTL